MFETLGDLLADPDNRFNFADARLLRDSVDARLLRDSADARLLRNAGDSKGVVAVLCRRREARALYLARARRDSVGGCSVRFICLAALRMSNDSRSSVTISSAGPTLVRLELARSGCSVVVALLLE